MYTLARCATELDDRPTRLRAYGTLQVAAGTPTHLFMFLGYYKGLCMSRNGSTGFNKLHKVRERLCVLCECFVRVSACMRVRVCVKASRGPVCVCVCVYTPTHLFMFLGYYKGLWMSRNGSTGFNKLHKVCVCVCLSVCLYVCVCACEHASVLALQ